LSQWPFFKSYNSTQKIPTSGRNLFSLSMNFGYHLAVGPSSGSSIWWVKKNSRLCAEKKNSTDARVPIWAVSAHRTTVHAHFWLFLPNEPLWVINMDHCVLENHKNNVLDSFLGLSIQWHGQKGHLKKTNFLSKFFFLKF
jgi:hypothetical protein